MQKHWIQTEANPSDKADDCIGQYTAAQLPGW
jgi:hypothetical protein